MQRFDCLAKECSLFGPHLLEASAGTGKTFAIEHIYARLILESIEVEQILVVTFTRAATRELKGRIRANLEKCLSFLLSEQTEIEYLQLYLKSDAAIRLLGDAIASFDRCQIFTIHGFCYRMLKEFAFEANVGAVLDPDDMKASDRLKEVARDFLEHGIDEGLLCKEQLAFLLKDFDSVENIVERLVKMDSPNPSRPFRELLRECKAALHPLLAPYGGRMDPEKLLEDFRALEKGYKTAVKGDFECQVMALAELEKEENFRILLRERGTIFNFLSLENRKVKAVEPKLHYPGFFDLAREHVLPLLKEDVFALLQAAFNTIAEKILEEEEGFNHDEILARMKKSMENPLFADSVQKKYQAALVDEFQDTDAVQWEIFQKIFLKGSLRSLFLVGDPKQSIYRFRKADIYTYLKAKEALGEACIYHLDTNFRSSKDLIGALNVLFSRDWFHLPKVSKSLPYYPVKAGSKIQTSFPDHKGAVHFILSEGEPNALFDEVFLPFMVQEIESLKLENVAVLVKDRYQTEKVLDFLKKRGIPAVAKSHIPIGKTLGFQAVRELFEAVISPRDPNLLKIVMAGPFGKNEISLPDLKALLLEKGVVPFSRKVLEGISTADILQVFERLFIWEKQEGFSLEGILRFFSSPEHLDAEKEGRRRLEVNEKAVQVMTLHISKGLEFDVVFPLGLVARTPESEEEEELNAEKLRQLYVAMTRAKKRLYVPVAQSSKEVLASTKSPMELFSRYFEGSFLEQITTLARQESITWETVSSPIVLPPALLPEVVYKPVCLRSKTFRPIMLSSFSSLAKVKEADTRYVENEIAVFNLQTMPRGSETGTVLHKIFELIFASVKPVWRDREAVDAIVEKELTFSHLAAWKNSIKEMVQQVLCLQLKTKEEVFCLSDVDCFKPEMEFIFSNPPHFIKGFIDLAFLYKEKIYFLDWKSNWLEGYDECFLKKAMQFNDYELQAALYAEALKRYASTPMFGGAFYVFLRGPAALYVENFEGCINDIQI